MLLSIWLLTSVGHIWLLTAMKCFIIFGRKQWTLFTQQNRRGSQTLRHEEYDATRCRVARRPAALGNVHEVACLTGAFVSPMRYSVI